MTSEAFKPISVSHDGSLPGRLKFALRCALDLQLLTIYRFLRLHVPALRGRVLDVGCGESPYAHLLGPAAHYTGVDILDAAAFGMRPRPEVVGFDGRILPFPAASFDHVLCTEVIEHVADPAAFVAELRRVLKPGGSLIATIPFSAREHHLPYDFQRYTAFGLRLLFADFAELRIEPRGNDLASIAAKLVVVGVRAGRPPTPFALRLPLLLLLAPFAGLALLVAHLALAFGFGAPGDPLGYAIICRAPATAADPAGR